MFTISSGKQTHAREITKLNNLLGYPTSEKDVENILKSVLHNEDHKIFVAEDETISIGFAHLVYSIRIGSKPFVEIAGLIINPKFQNQGIGKAFLAESEKWALEKDCSEIRIRKSIISQKAYRFFGKAGFQLVKNQEYFFKIVKSD